MSFIVRPALGHQVALMDLMEQDIVAFLELEIII